MNDAKEKQPRVTVYNGGFAVVGLVKEMDVKNAGLNNYSLEGVATQIDESSVKLKGLDGRVKVLEQNFENDLVGSGALLEKCVGENIEVYKQKGTTEEKVEGTLLAYEGGQVVLQTGRGLEVFKQSGFNLPQKVREGLKLKPTLEWKLNTAKAGPQNVELSYITSGMSWEANYVVALSSDEKSMDLQAWVDINNQSGQKFENAKVKLVAGEVKRVREAMPMRAMYAMDEGLESAGGASNRFSEEQLADYHMFTLDGETSISNKSSKQIGLLTGDDISVTKTYRADQGGKVGVYMSFENSEENNLGKPLPAGKVKFFKPDSEGQPQYIGEAKVDNVSVGEEVKDLHIGNAFDIKLEQTVLQDEHDRNISQRLVQYDVSNGKKEDLTVEIPIAAQGSDTTVQLPEMYKNVSLEQKSAHEYIAKVDLGAESKHSFKVYTKITRR